LNYCFVKYLFIDLTDKSDELVATTCLFLGSQKGIFNPK
jgi:predicted metal-binding protein